jgi:hypothetical protein
MGAVKMADVRRSLVLGIGVVALFGSQTLTRVHARDGAEAPVTFNKDVAPIVFKNCASCQRSGEMALMALTSFKDTRPWANTSTTRSTART